MADSQENKDHNPSQENSAVTPCTTPDRKTDATSTDTVKGTGKSVEHGGPKGLEPTRYGDWERNGRCTDF